MKIVVSIDSFKGSLSSVKAAEAAREGILEAMPDALVTVCPLADGGEGTVDAILASSGGRTVSLTVTGPLGEPVEAKYGVTDQGYTVIEMASAAGLTLVDEQRCDPEITTTYGVGELLLHAINSGARKFIIGIGGSATNDGGVGMLEALGFEFLDKDGKRIGRGCRGLKDLYRISDKGVPSALSECEFTVASDVENPLCGETGCSRIFAPQKGGTEESIQRMDSYLAGYARVAKEFLGKDLSNEKGAGAAGGMGFALISFLGARLESGIDLIIRAADIESKISDSDLVITGEGRLDGQSCMGKAPVGIARAAKKHGKIVVAICGSVKDDAYLCHDHGIDAYFPILPAPTSLEDAMREENAYKNLKNTAREVTRLLATTKT